MADVRSGVQKKKGVSEGVSVAFVTKKSDRTFGYPTPESLPAATDACESWEGTFMVEGCAHMSISAFACA